MSKLSRLTVLWGTALLVPALSANAQDEWKAPQSAAATENPISASADSIRAGKVAYKNTCVSCHGARGDGDGFAAGMLKRKPKALAGVLGGQSDGELFWKVRAGNAFMPSQAEALSEEETWHLVNFMRTLEPQEPGAHPWASFPEGAWVDVHTDHEMVIGAGEPTEWASDSRMTVGSITDDAVTILHVNPGREVSEQASLVIPAVDAFPGVRALGQWPHDIFPYGPERESGVTAADKQPVPHDLKTRTLREEQIELDGEQMTVQVIHREWKAGDGDDAPRHVLTAWIVDGIELPVEWTLTVDGKLLSESKLVSLSEPVKVGELNIPCVVTVTKKHLSEGLIVKRRWSSSEVPGFLVKMESSMETDAFSLTVNEWVTDFRASAPDLVQEEEDGGNPPGSRPALGFMPDYESGEDGVLVSDVSPGGPAEEGGMLAGDLIIAIGDEEIHGLEDYMDVLYTLRIGKEVTVKILREGLKKDLHIVVGEREG
jgi:mono/diheme cytochrome c family protein